MHKKFNSSYCCFISKERRGNTENLGIAIEIEVEQNTNTDEKG